MKYLKYLILILIILTPNLGCKGPKGDSIQGQQCETGQSCLINQLENGAEIKCGDNTSAVILNGNDGKDLVPSMYSVLSVIDPCGKQGSHDEVLLKLNNGQLMGHYSDGNKQFLTFLNPGNYVTTDGTNCRFSVDSNLNVTY